RSTPTNGRHGTPMEDVLARALNAAQLRGATYADARTVESRSQFLEVKNRRVSGLLENAGAGLGVRVLVDGAWGFASTADPGVAEAERAAELACRIARASAKLRHEPVSLSPLAPHTGSYATPIVRDPFEVPLADKISLLVEATGIMERERGIRVARGGMQFWE